MFLDWTPPQSELLKDFNLETLLSKLDLRAEIGSADWTLDTWYWLRIRSIIRQKYLPRTSVGPLAQI